ncbi:hypothetical protein [Lichenifustis flavocetrariae]|uniref:Uncharacterized protein n=1 Tax=Lichenifustis flavocetrariae TaxID=2949735 RepID=A0AA41Z345_9HYPH|nr:hypothetical protein [Lichenifustis flavocetrariae]MCW6512849.1 hypothetical protein [Lichenifustis flavocetrariae]
MRRFANAEIILGFFLGLFVTLLFVGVNLYQADHCAEERQQSQAGPGKNPSPEQKVAHPHSEDDEREEEITSYAKAHPGVCGIAGFPRMTVGYLDHHEGFFVGLFTMALFGATFFLWRSTEKLWKAGEDQRVLSEKIAIDQSINTRESLRIASEAAHASLQASQTAAAQLAQDRDAIIVRERAYFAFQQFGTIHGFEDNILKWWLFDVQWRNSGNRPPRAMVGCTSYCLFPEMIEPEFSFPDLPVDPQIPRSGKIFVAPQTSIRGAMIRVPVSDMIAIAEGRKYLMIWGWVEYDDGFEDTPRRRSEFAAIVTMLGKATEANAAHANIRMHPRHNGTDDECTNPIVTARGGADLQPV